MWRTPLGDEGGDIAGSDTANRTLTREHIMIEYELQQARSAELRRQAEHERLARAVRRGRRAARREAEARRAAEETHTDHPRQHRVARPA